MTILALLTVIYGDAAPLSKHDFVTYNFPGIFDRNNIFYVFLILKSLEYALKVTDVGIHCVTERIQPVLDVINLSVDLVEFLSEHLSTSTTDEKNRHQDCKQYFFHINVSYISLKHIHKRYRQLVHKGKVAGTA